MKTRRKRALGARRGRKVNAALARKHLFCLPLGQSKAAKPKAFRAPASAVPPPVHRENKLARCLRHSIIALAYCRSKGAAGRGREGVGQTNANCRERERKKPAVRLEATLFASPIGRVLRFRNTRTQRRRPRSFHKNALERGKGAGSRRKAARSAEKLGKKEELRTLKEKRRRSTETVEGGREEKKNSEQRKILVLAFIAIFPPRGSKKKLYPLTTPGPTG